MCKRIHSRLTSTAPQSCRSTLSLKMLDHFPAEILSIIVNLVNVEDAKSLIHAGNRILNMKLRNIAVDLLFFGDLEKMKRCHFMLSFFRNVKSALFWDADRNILSLLQDSVEVLSVHTRISMHVGDLEDVQILPRNLKVLNLPDIPLRREHAISMPRSLTKLTTSGFTAYVDHFCEFAYNLPHLTYFRFESQCPRLPFGKKCALALPKTLERLELSTACGIDEDFIEHLPNGLTTLWILVAGSVSLRKLPKSVTSVEIFKCCDGKSTPWKGKMFPKTLRHLEINSDVKFKDSDMERFATHLLTLNINGGIGEWNQKFLDEQAKLADK